MFDWLQNITDWLLYDKIGMNSEAHLSHALNFFIYDSIKIIMLLFLIVFIMGIVNSYFPVEKVRNYLSRKKLYGLEYLFASFFGVVTPFCSCSSVPLFIGFVKGGIPLGVTFSFLITSPLVNEVAIAIFYGLFGLKVTVIYVISGVLLGTVAGVILQKLKLERFLTPWVLSVMEKAEVESQEFKASNKPFTKRLPEIWKEAMGIIKGIIWYVIIGIAIGGLMHGYIPEGYFEQYMTKENLLAVPFAAIVSVPIYSNAAGVLPVIEVLVNKGIPLGTAIAFMMGTIGLSIPEAMLLKKVMTWKLIGIFFGVVTFCIIISGYIFNIIF